jgi:hypothetical protein
MREENGMVRRLLIGAVLAALSVAGPASADELSDGFAEADLDGDGRLDADEYLAAVILTFAARDEDRDRLLTSAELPEASAEGIARIDSDGDGMISVGEAAGAGSCASSTPTPTVTACSRWRRCASISTISGRRLDNEPSFRSGRRRCGADDAGELREPARRPPDTGRDPGWGYRGALGSLFGGGTGRVVATGVGAVVGSIAGSNIADRTR